MRVASALLFCDETDETTYRANELTSLLVRPGWKGAFQWGEIIYPIATDIRRFVSSTSFCRTGDAAALSAYEFSQGKTIWKLLEEQPDLRDRFDLWMRERRLHEERLWHKRHPPCLSLGAANLKTDP